MSEILPGAEPFSADGGDIGVLLLHGFTGSPSSMRGLAMRMAEQGYAVELPLLSGHGTTVDDMKTTGWADWTADANDAYDKLAARTNKVVVAGLSMGGTLAIWMATQHPELSGLITINPAVMEMDPPVVDLIKGTLAAGDDEIAAVGSDIAKPDVVEVAYQSTPLAPLISLAEGLAALQSDLASIRCPTIIFTSPQDHVVEPKSSDHLAAAVSGPVERVTLEKSYHVATQDFDAEIIFTMSTDFVAKVTA